MNNLNALKLGFVREVLGTERTPLMFNLLQLKSYLEENGVSDGDIVKTIKEVFDRNLPPLYKNIVGSTGLCGYWSLVYNRLFTAIGFKSHICQIDTLGNKYIHTFVRIYTSDCLIDVDRGKSADVRKDSSSDLLDYWINNIKSHLRSDPLVYNIDDISVFKTSFYMESKVQLDDYVLDELYKYTDILSVDDIRKYNYIPLRDLCNPVLTRILLGKASEIECIAYRLMNRKENNICGGLV